MLYSFGGASCPCCRNSLTTGSSAPSSNLLNFQCGDCLSTSDLRKGLLKTNDGKHSKMTPKVNDSIWAAASNGDIDRVQYIIEKRNGQPDKLDAFGYSPLHKASLGNHHQIITYLLKLGGKPDHNTCGATPLHRATSWRSLECMKALLDGGADIHAVDTSFQDLRTPLHKACDIGFLNGIKLLLQYNASTSIRDKRNHTPLEVAIVNGHIDCVRFLWGIKTNTNKDQHLLYLAINSGQVEIVQTFFLHEIGIISSKDNHVSKCIEIKNKLQDEKERLDEMDRQAHMVSIHRRKCLESASKSSKLTCKKANNIEAGSTGSLKEGAGTNVPVQKISGLLNNRSNRRKKNNKSNKSNKSNTSNTSNET